MKEVREWKKKKLQNSLERHEMWTMNQEKAFAGRTGMELETIKKNFRSVESEMGVPGDPREE